jgi:hypothetical protein
MTLRMQVVPVDGFRLFGALVRKEVDLYRKKQGTFFRSGPKVKDRARWSGFMIKGAVSKTRSSSATQHLPAVAPLHESIRAKATAALLRSYHS